jgi:hypothetical protein
MPRRTGFPEIAQCCAYRPFCAFCTDQIYYNFHFLFYSGFPLSLVILSITFIYWLDNLVIKVHSRPPRQAGTGNPAMQNFAESPLSTVFVAAPFADVKLDGCSAGRQGAGQGWQGLGRAPTGSQGGESLGQGLPAVEASAGTPPHLLPWMEMGRGPPSIEIPPVVAKGPTPATVRSHRSVWSN